MNFIFISSRFEWKQFTGVEREREGGVGGAADREAHWYN